jgi:tRNA(fMet)-specific endonuclease VapC
MAPADSLVVDTDVVSFIFKKDSRATPYERHLEGKRVCVSFMTVAEVYQWAISRRWGKRRIKELRQELARYVVLPYDDATAWIWGEVRSIKGRPVEAKDAWIAATALRHGMKLVTHNRRHFEGIAGLQIISEG